MQASMEVGTMTIRFIVAQCSLTMVMRCTKQGPSRAPVTYAAMVSIVRRAGLFTSNCRIRSAARRTSAEAETTLRNRVK